jgi:hypothetical protein
MAGMTVGTIGAGAIADAMRAGAVVRAAVTWVGMAAGTFITVAGQLAGVGVDPGTPA